MKKYYKYTLILESDIKFDEFILEDELTNFLDNRFIDYNTKIRIDKILHIIE